MSILNEKKYDIKPNVDLEVENEEWIVKRIELMRNKKVPCCTPINSKKIIVQQGKSPSNTQKCALPMTKLMRKLRLVRKQWKWQRKASTKQPKTKSVTSGYLHGSWQCTYICRKLGKLRVAVWESIHWQPRWSRCSWFSGSPSKLVDNPGWCKKWKLNKILCFWTIFK